MSVDSPMSLWLAERDSELMVRLVSSTTRSEGVHL